MPGLRTTTLAFLSCLPAAGSAQQPTLSPALERALARDTTVAVWLFLRPAETLAGARVTVARLGGRLRRESRWLHAVSADLPSGGLRLALARPDLLHIQPVVRFVQPRGPAPDAAAPVDLAAAPASLGPSAMPFARLNLIPLVSRGLRGQGIRIALLDTGFETGFRAFASALVLAQRDFIRNDDVVRNEAGDQTGQSGHGTATWSLLAALIPDTLIGIAPDAEYLLAKTEDVADERRTEEDDYVAALEWADSLGAQVVSASLGYLSFPNDGFSYPPSQLNGDVAVTTRAADLAAERGITVVVSVGNGGPGAQTLSSPADGDSVIAVGAVDSSGALAGFSARGPTADNRIKPDLTAPGVAVWVAAPSAASGFGRSNGTSFSAPIVAGAAALLKQAHPTFGPIEIRDALRAAGDNAATPNSSRGWGTPNAAAATVFPQGLILTGPADSLLREPPTFTWVAAGVPALAQPVLQYDFRVVRAATGGTEYEALGLAGASHTPPALRPNLALRGELTARLGPDTVATVRTRVFALGQDAPPITLLFQNFPNPFPDRATGLRATCVWFDLAVAGPTQLEVLDLRGHPVRRLIPAGPFGPDLPAGKYGRGNAAADAGCDPDLQWDGTTADGRRLPRGIYLLRLETPAGIFFKRIVFLGPDV